MIRPELEKALTGRKFGKIFQLSRFELVVDFRIPDSQYLFISIEPANPRIYLIKRRLRDLEKGSGNPSAFHLYLRKRLSGFEVTGIGHIPGERVLIIELRGSNELGDLQSFSLAVQLTGRSANLFLLDRQGIILETARDTRGPGQSPGETYSAPARPENDRQKAATSTPNISTEFSTLSEALDTRDLENQAERRFQSIANAARNKVKQEITRREKLARNLGNDLATHGDAERWKRFGDLLLANVSTAKRSDGNIFVVDYFDENLPKVEIAADAEESITEAAERYFRRYTKARNAAEEIANRLRILESELKALREDSDRIETAIAERDETLLADFIKGRQAEPTEKARGKQLEVNAGTRSFISSDGYEILVGKKAKDNDYLTFRIAKSLDLWMHAADYPGSHVVIRNPNRKEIPYRTLLEAAQLAAFYSQGKTQPKAAVHYTQKKFVNKPKGAAPGLVSLASFKTILVEPGVPETVGTPSGR